MSFTVAGAQPRNRSKTAHVRRVAGISDRNDAGVRLLEQSSDIHCPLAARADNPMFTVSLGAK